METGHDLHGLALRSPSLVPGTLIPEKYVFNGMGCRGQNLSPRLEWEGEPEETKSFAITVKDPDARVDGGWSHWMLINIPSNVHALEEGASSQGTLPEGALEVKNDFKESHYGGPCPPKGDGPHRYVFTLYALKSDHLKTGARSTIEADLEKNCLAKASFTVLYKR